ncbi:MAG TPA: VOC family protein [Usitatibacter sp.]|nr:VOC family protein [Usitatibacter sp.]
MKVKRTTAVLLVDRVEPTADFFGRMGFVATIEVREGNGVGFALLERDGEQVMVETRDNERESAALRAVTLQSRSALVFLEVDDLDAVVDALRGAPVLVERHSTFYGADEITYTEPGGNLVTFAQFTR